jgi:hypothetical protein
MGIDEKKRIIFLGAFGLIAVLFVQFILFPVLDFKTESRERYDRQQLRLDRLQEKATLYRQLVTSRKSQAKQFDTGKGALLGAVNKEVKRLRLTGKLASMKPGTSQLANGFKEESVTLRFNNLYLEEALKFLYAMQEGHEGVLIKGLSLARKKGNLLSADIIFAMTMPE